jgi:hypothetical protein
MQQELEAALSSQGNPQRNVASWLPGKLPP